MSIGTLVIFLGVMAGAAALAAVWSAAETSLFSLTHRDRARLRKSSPWAQTQASYLLARPGELMVAILLASTTVSTGYYVVAALFGESLSGWPAIVVAVASPILLILAGELLPKTLASIHRVRFAQWLAPPTMGWFWASTPIRRFVEIGMVRPIVRVIAPGFRNAGGVSVDDISDLIDHTSSSGALAHDERRLLGEVVELGTRRVREVMTPRVDLPWIPLNANGRQIAAAVLRSGAERLPVLAPGGQGGCVGVLAARRYLANRAARRGRGDPSTQAFIQPVRYVPDAARLDQLLEHFSSTRTHVAMCVSENGAVTGMVTAEDIVASLVGTRRAHARGDDAPVMIALGRWSVRGRTGLREFADAFGVDLADEVGVSTVAGLLAARLGRVPVAGDRVRVGPLSLAVRSVRGPAVQEAEVVFAEDAP